MLRTLIAAAAAIAIFSAGSAISTGGSAAGSHAPGVKGKYVASNHYARVRRSAPRGYTENSEFSSSSAGRKHTSPGR